MSKLISLFKSFTTKQVLTVFLSSCLLFISTACSQNPTAQIDGVKDVVERQISDNYDNYDANQGYKGGMNGYDDDRRYDSQTAAKTKGLVDNAKRLQTDDLEEYTENIIDRAENQIETASKKIPSQLQSNKEQAVNYVRDKSENLKDNLSQVPGEAKNIFSEAVDTAQGAIEDTQNATTKRARDIKGNLEDLT